MKPLLLPFLLGVSLLSVAGCGGEEEADPADSKIEFASSSSDYNGTSSSFTARSSRSIGRDTTTVTVGSGYRRFRIVLHDDVLKKGQEFRLNDSSEATATYDEGSDTVWVATSGRAEVTEEVLGKFTVQLRDLQFEPKDESDNEALGTFSLKGRLVRR
ncbi:hypothetical protein EON77_21455 [bacterium]|nr:MAG: hypothetical protein EON77_21455 [bacterium]